MDIPEGFGELQKPLPGKAKKTAESLAMNVMGLAETYGIENLGFLTLTFKDFVVDPAEASARFNSLASNVLRSRYRDYIRVMERCKSGRIHYHLLVVLHDDIRTGCDFAGIANRDYSSANPALRAEWAFWRATAPRFRFGRTELLPVKSTKEGVARYIGKYISKTILCRDTRDKGARLVSMSRTARTATSNFMWVSANTRVWRLGCEVFARKVCTLHGFPGLPMDDSMMVGWLGKNWCFKHREEIFQLGAEEACRLGLVKIA